MIKLSKTSKLDGILSWSLQAIDTCPASIDNNWRMVNAFERGINDGFFQGTQNPPLDRSDDEQAAYKRGYDRGLWLYCETLDNE